VDEARVDRATQGERDGVVRAAREADQGGALLGCSARATSSSAGDDG
jgi:hypothetical protein